MDTTTESHWGVGGLGISRLLFLSKLPGMEDISSRLFVDNCRIERAGRSWVWGWSLHSKIIRQEDGASKGGSWYNVFDICPRETCRLAWEINGRLASKYVD